MSLPAADTYRRYLGAHADLVEFFPLTDLDRTRVPVVSASAWGEFSAHGVGYGETQDEAERSALGEAAETLAAARFAARCAPRALPVGEAVARGGIHPGALSPVAGTHVDDTRSCCGCPPAPGPAGRSGCFRSKPSSRVARSSRAPRPGASRCSRRSRTAWARPPRASRSARSATGSWSSCSAT